MPELAIERTPAPVCRRSNTLPLRATSFSYVLLEVLEASAVDGAGAVRTFTLITLPHLRQYTEIAVILATILLLQAFDPIAIMTRGTGGTKTLSYLLYERAFVGLEVGEAAAYGVITVIITIAFALVALRTLFKVFSSEGIAR